MGELPDDRFHSSFLASSYRALTRAQGRGGSRGADRPGTSRRAADVDIGPDAAQRLAELGVTSLAVLRDDAATAVALEGWAFDPDASGEAAARAVAVEAGGLRVLRPVLETAIHLASPTGPGRRSTS
jgi:hypothetical protein